MSDEGCCDADEGQEVLGLALVSTVQAPTASQPGHCSLHDPAVTAEPVRRFGAFASNARGDVPLSKPSPQVGVVIPLVGVEFVGLASTRAAAGADRRDTADQWLQSLTVVKVGGRDPQGQRKSVPVRDQVDLPSVLAAIGRIRSRQQPPFAARILTESIAQRDQSSSPRAPNSSRITRCSRAHTRARLHWAKRR